MAAIVADARTPASLQDMRPIMPKRSVTVN